MSNEDFKVPYWDGERYVEPEGYSAAPKQNPAQPPTPDAPAAPYTPRPSAPLGKQPAPVRWPSRPHDPGLPPVQNPPEQGTNPQTEASERGNSTRSKHRKGRAALVLVSLGLMVAADIGFERGIMNQDVWENWQDRADYIAGKIGYTTGHQVAKNRAALDREVKPTMVPTPTTVPTPTPVQTPTTTPSMTSEQCVAQLPVEVKLGQRIMAPIKGDMLQSKTVQKAFNEHYIGGAILMTEPVNPADGSIQDFRKAQRIPIRVATDQEGGTVMRFKEGAANLPSAAEAAKMSPVELEKKVTNVYKYLRSLGISAVFAPVVDVAPLQSKTQIGESRLFGSDPKKVAQTAEIYIRAGKAAKMHVTLKHFPGMGSASGNTDMVVATDPSLTELKKRDLVPYEILKGSGADVMVGSPIVPGLTGGKPANLSPATYKLLREDMGYADAVTYTDDLSTPAFKLPLDKTFKAALIAGADMPLFVNLPKGVTLDQELTKIVDAGVQAVKDGTLSEQQLNESVSRIFASKDIDGCDVLHAVTPKAEATEAPTELPTPTTSSPSSTLTKTATATATAKATVAAGKK